MYGTSRERRRFPMARTKATDLERARVTYRLIRQAVMVGILGEEFTPAKVNRALGISYAGVFCASMRLETPGGKLSCLFGSAHDLLQGIVSWRGISGRGQRRWWRLVASMRGKFPKRHQVFWRGTRAYRARESRASRYVSRMSESDEIVQRPIRRIVHWRQR
jgi:hypothetical protein